MLTYIVDTMGYLISSTMLDDMFSCGALAACICVVRMLFNTRRDNL